MYTPVRARLHGMFTGVVQLAAAAGAAISAVLAGFAFTRRQRTLAAEAAGYLGKGKS